MMPLSGKTRICCVIGDPIAHTLSPTIHNAAFKHLKLDFVYLAFRVKSNRSIKTADITDTGTVSTANKNIMET